MKTLLVRIVLLTATNVRKQNAKTTAAEAFRSGGDADAAGAALVSCIARSQRAVGTRVESGCVRRQRNRGQMREDRCCGYIEKSQNLKTGNC